MTTDQPGYAAVPTGPVLAGRGRRLVARIIDWIILGVVSTVLTWGQFRQLNELTAQYQTSSDPMGIYSDPEYWNATAVSGLVTLVLWVVYEGVLTRLRGATLGKMAMGLRVEPVRGGQVGWGRSLGRVLVWYLPVYLTCGLWFVLDSLWCLWDPRKQTLHDKIVGTVVLASR